jgi:hypothetical protein
MQEPTLLNVIELETKWGYKAFELYQGNIVHFRQEVDLLAVSALSNDLRVLAGDPSHYSFVHHTLIGALYLQAGIDVASHSKQCEFDFRNALGCWVSHSTDSPIFKRIVCAENIGLQRNIEETVDNLFVVLSILEAKNIKVRFFVLPLLGAGGMGLDTDAIMRALLSSAQNHLSRLQTLERIMFIERDMYKAEALNQAMNTALGRVKVVIPKGELIENIRRDILHKIDSAVELVTGSNLNVMMDLRRFVASEKSRSFEIGIIGRRLVEFIVNDLSSTKKGQQLWVKIDGLAEHGIADWIRSYMHTIRIFGNESAHEKNQPNRRPIAVAEVDVTICLFCIQRVLGFWVELKLNK